MKIALILLLSLSAVLCTQTHDTIQTDELQLWETDLGIVDAIKDMIDKFIQSIKNQFNAILDRLKEILARTYAKIISTLEKARSKLKTVTLRAEFLINSLKSKGGTYKECAEKVELELASLKNSTNGRLNKCAEDYVQKLNEYEEGIKKNITEIENKINELRVAVIDCIHFNPIETTKCLYSKLNEYRQKIGEILKEVQNDVTNAALEAVNVIKSVQVCSKNAISDAITETEVINKKLDGCFGLETTTTTTTSEAPPPKEQPPALKSFMSDRLMGI